MNSLSENLLIRSGELFKDFVTLPLSQFLKIKNKYNLTQAPTNINEFYDFNGRIDISIRSDKEDICDKILGDIKVKNSLFSNLQMAIKSLIDECKIISEKLKNISLAFKDLSSSYSISLNGKYLQKTFHSLDQLFLDWSNSYKNQMTFFSDDILEFFRFIDSELYTFKSLEDNYSKKKKMYMNNKKILNNNLENPEVILKIKTNLIKSKSMYGYYLNKYYDEYFRLNEVHSERLKKLIDKMNKQKDTYFSDMIKLVQLLSINK